MEQVYIASANPKYDSYVLFIQQQLNNIRNTLLHNLPIVGVDGYYGYETAKVVKAFQQSCNIRADGVFGPQTRMHMAQKMREMPSIGNSSGPLIKRTSINKFSLYDVVDQFVSSILDFNSTIQNVANSLSKLHNPTPNLVFKCFRRSLEKVDPKIKILRESLAKHNLFKDNSKVSADINNKAKGNLYKSHIGIAEQDSIRKAQQTVSNANTNKRLANKYMAKSMKTKDVILNNLKKYDFVSKVTQKLKTMGLTGKIDLSKVSVKGGVGIGFVYSLKDIIWDIFHICELFDESKSTAWQEDLRKDCYAFLDSLIIGYTSLFLAQLIVVGGSALAGLTMSSGAVIAAVVIITLILGLIISYLLSKKDISFSRFIFEDCAEFIISKIYSVPM